MAKNALQQVTETLQKSPLYQGLQESFDTFRGMVQPLAESAGKSIGYALNPFYQQAQKNIQQASQRSLKASANPNYTPESRAALLRLSSQQAKTGQDLAQSQMQQANYTPLQILESAGATAASVFGGPKMLTRPGMINTGIAALLGGGINKMTGGSFAQGAGRAVGMMPAIEGIVGATNPAISQLTSKAGRLNTNPWVQQGLIRLTGGALNIPQGYAIAKSAGQTYTPGNAALDFGLGAILPTTHTSGKMAIKDTAVAPEMVKLRETLVTKGMKAQEAGDVALANKIKAQVIKLDKTIQRKVQAQAVKPSTPVEKVSQEQVIPKGTTQAMQAVKEVKLPPEQTIEGLPFKVEPSVATAVQTLYNDGVLVKDNGSSGFHTKWKEPQWAIAIAGTVKKDVQDLLAKAAEDSGLAFRERMVNGKKSGVDIYLPGVGPEKPDIAQQAFDAFANRYTELKQIASTTSPVTSAITMPKNVREIIDRIASGEKVKTNELKSIKDFVTKTMQIKPDQWDGMSVVKRKQLATESYNTVLAGEKAVHETSFTPPTTTEGAVPPLATVMDSGLPPGEVTRGLIDTAKESSNVLPEAKAQVEGSYTSIGQQATVNKFAVDVATNYEKAKADLYKTTPDQVNLDTVVDFTAKAEALIFEAGKRGDAQTQADVINKVAPFLTPMGQANSLFALMAKSTPEAILKLAEEAIKSANENVPAIERIAKFIGVELPRAKQLELSVDAKQTILDMAKQTQAMPDGPEKVAAGQALTEYINKQIPLSVGNWLDAYRYNNMLSSPNTWEKTFIQNTSGLLVFKPMTMAMRGLIIDPIRELATGAKPEYQPLDFARWYGDLFTSLGAPDRTSAAFANLSEPEKAIASIVPDTIDTFKNAMTGKEIDQRDINQALSIKAKASQSRFPAILTWASRFMSMLDAVGRVPIAKLEYAQKVRNGEAAGEETMKKAFNEADYWTLRTQFDPKGTKSGQGGLFQVMDAIAQGITKIGGETPAVSYILPFVKASNNFAKMTMEYSPLGVLDMPFSKRLADKSAKALIGTGTMLMLWKWASDPNNVSWELPTDKKGQTTAYDAGRRPYSIRVPTPAGDIWVPVQAAGPLAVAISIPAAYTYYSQQAPTALTDDQATKVAKTMGGLVKMMSNWTFLESVQQFMDMISGKGNLNTYAGFTAGQMVPDKGLLSWVNRSFIDPVFRKATTFPEAMAKDLPILSQDVPAYTNSVGQPSTRTTLERFSPYAIGQANPFYEKMYQDDQAAAQFRAKITAMQDAFDKKDQALISQIKQNGDMQLPNENAYGTTLDSAGLAGIIKKQRQFSDANKLVELYMQAQQQGNKEGVAGIEATIKQMGIPFQDAYYNYFSQVDPEVKRFFLDQSIQSQGLTGDQAVPYLAQFRRKGVGSGQPILTDTLVDALVTDNVISYDAGKVLKKITWSEQQKSLVAKPSAPKKSGANVKAPKLKAVPKYSSIKIKPVTTAPKMKISSVKPVATKQVSLKLPTVTSMPKIPVIKLKQIKLPVFNKLPVSYS